MALNKSRKALAVLFFLVLGGCYTYVRVDGYPPPAGKEVRAHLRPARDFGVGEIMVRDVTRIEGVMWTATADTIAVWGTWFHTALGTRFAADNAVLYLPRSGSPQLEVRKLHPARTVVVLGLLGVLGTGFVNFLVNPGGDEGLDADKGTIDLHVISNR